MRLRKYIKLTFVLIVFALSFLACNSERSGGADGKKTFKGVGVVRAKDAGRKEITIDHKDIPGLMPAEEMTFPVGDAKLIEKISERDMVEFELERTGSDVSVVKIDKIGEVAKSSFTSDSPVIYKANCAECHGEDGEGVEGKGISFLKGHALHHPEEDFIEQVENGEEDKMPAFRDKLSADEIRAVVRYVREELQSRAEKKQDGGHQH